jgi:two-component system OmpR family sensor kinase
MGSMIDSVRARLTAWYVAVLAVTLIVFELGVYAALSGVLHDNVDDTLVSAIEVTTTSLSNDIGEGQSRSEAARATVDEISSRLVAVAVFDQSGELMASRDWADDVRPTLPADSQIPQDEPRLYDVIDDDDRVRVGIRRVRVRADIAPFVVHVSTPLELLEDDLEDIRTVLLSSIPVVLLIAGGAGWFMARKSLHPVMLMADRARAIGATNLDQRLPVANPRDELGRLANTFNELLSRVSKAFTQQRQFMADASHELKTPLATIRAATDVTLQQRTRSEDEYRDALRMITDQAQRLSRIVEDMFTLARADAGHLPLRQTSFYIDDMLADVATTSSLRGAARDVQITFTGPSDVACVGDEHLIRRLVDNLVDNAIRYSPAGAAVDITLEHVGQVARISITDRGPGIPAESWPHIFERFYRADVARSRGSSAEGSGAGLGLAIARWVAEAHGGTLLLLRSDEQGTTFVAELPCRARS